MQVVGKDLIPAFDFTLHDDVGLGFVNGLVNGNVNAGENGEHYHLNILNSWISNSIISNYGVVASYMVRHIVNLERVVIKHPPLKPKKYTFNSKTIFICQ